MAELEKERQQIEKNLDNMFQNQEKPENNQSTIENKQEQINRPNIQRSSKTRIVRVSSGDKKRKPKCCQEQIGRSGKVDADLYWKVKEENERFKQQQAENNDKFKELKTKLNHLGEKIIKERINGEKRVIYLDEGSELEMINLRSENEKLKDQLRKTKTVIKGLQTNERSRKSGPKNLISAKMQLDKASNHNEYLKLINELKNGLHSRDLEIKRLQAELYGPDSKVKGIDGFSKDIREKNLQLNEVQSKYEKMQYQMDTNNKMMKHMQDNLDEFKAKLREEQQAASDLRRENATLQANMLRLPEYVALIEEYKNREREYEERIQNLCESPFIKQAEERGNIFRKLKETEKAFAEQEMKLANTESKLKEIEHDYRNLKDDYELIKKEKDQFKEDAMRLKITTEERDKNTRNFEEQLKLLGQYGEVDSNFTKILSMLKLNQSDDTWMKVKFLDRLSEEDMNDPQVLLKEIERLVQEKGILGRQLDITKNVLELQQKISEDLQKEKEELQKITTYQINELTRKCEEQARHIDIDKRPIQARHRKDSPRRLVKDLGYDDGESVRDTITEFTIDENESVLGYNENILDLFIGEGVLEEGLEKVLGFKISNMMSFICVDFYLHELQTSNLSSGKRPWFNLQVNFKLIEDEHFLRYLESEEGIVLELFYMRDNVHALLARGLISLKQIIDSESEQSTNRVVHNVCSMFYSQDPNLFIGVVHYKLRMRRPLLAKLKWYRDKSRIINEISPIQEHTAKEIQKRMDPIEKLSKGKVMQVTVMITKLIDLKLPGAPHEIKPYVYYQFFKNEEHFTKVCPPNNHFVEDTQIYNVVYDPEFNDYIQNDAIEFLVLDDFRPLEVKLSNEHNENEVNLVDSPEVEDLIGICKVPLRELSASDRIHGNFPIVARNGHKSGEMAVLIFWEQVNLVDDSLRKVPYETRAWMEDLVIRLSEAIKNKKLTLESAFEMFNLDDSNMISRSNFKGVLFNQFKYTNSNEIENLTNIIFQDATFISRLEFNKVFSPLLPSSIYPDQSNRQPSVIVTHKQPRQENQIQENIHLDILGKEPLKQDTEDLKTTSLRGTRRIVKQKDKDLDASTSRENKEVKDIKDYRDVKDNLDLKERSESTLVFRNNSTDRPNREIMLNVADYMRRTNKHSVSELYKIFDKDGNSFITKREYLNGFNKINQPLSAPELDRMWAEMTGSKDEKNVDLVKFKRFYELFDDLRKKH